MRLARAVVDQFYSSTDGQAAEEAFVRQFVQHELPTDIPEHPLEAPLSIIDLMVAAGLSASKGEARRLIAGGGVRVDGEKVAGYDLVLEPGIDIVVQVGRRKFVRVK